MERKLIRGRSNSSYLLLAGKHVHVFLLGSRWGTREGTGVTVRHRRRDKRGWHHWRLLVGARNPRKERPGGKRQGSFLARPTLTVCELSHWETRPGTKDRYGVKSYIRLKVGPGGRER